MKWWILDTSDPEHRNPCLHPVHKYYIVQVVKLITNTKYVHHLRDY